MYIKYSEGNFLFLGTYKFAARILNHNEKNNTNQNESRILYINETHQKFMKKHLNIKLNKTSCENLVNLLNVYKKFYLDYI
jgi:hypothetical protein